MTDERIMGELLRDLASAVDAKDFALARRLLDAVPARLTGFEKQHRDVAMSFFTNLEYALDRIEARMVSDAKRLI